jgi:hypothetical protein
MGSFAIAFGYWWVLVELENPSASGMYQQYILFILLVFSLTFCLFVCHDTFIFYLHTFVLKGYLSSLFSLHIINPEIDLRILCG